MSYTAHQKKPHAIKSRRILKLSDEEIREINRLYDRGTSVWKIAMILKRGTSTIEKHLGLKV